jgi:apolipoprotein N-acyltransferase
MTQRSARSWLSLAPGGPAWQATLATATGLLLVFSFPNFDLNWLAWIALAPLLYALTSGVGLWRAFWLGWVAGLVFTFCAENWIAHSMTHHGGMLTALAYAVALLFAAILALFPAVFAAAVTQLHRAFGWWTLALAPAVWVGTEWLRPIITGVTWNALGISQASHFEVARLARYGGVYLVSWEVAAGSAVLVLLLKARQPAARLAAVLLAIAGLAALLIPAPPPQRETLVSVIGVQPNIPLTMSEAERARYFENNLALTREALRRAPDQTADLVIWAESPLSINYEDDEAARARLDAFTQELGGHLIFNAVARDGERYFNSAQTLSPRPGGAPVKLHRYDKIRLVPFGEYVPWRTGLGRFVPPIVGDFTPGTEAVVNLLKLQVQRFGLESADETGASVPLIERTTNFIRAGTFICYEAAYPDLVRRFTRNGATLLVNLSDDAWFGNTAGARQHLAHALMRAIENDRDLVRVTNSGITALITGEGRVVEALPAFTEAAQVWQAQARGGQTFYTRHGDWFAIGCAIVGGLALIAAVVRQARAETSG